MSPPMGARLITCSPMVIQAPDHRSPPFSFPSSAPAILAPVTTIDRDSGQTPATQASAHPGARQLILIHRTRQPPPHPRLIIKP